MLAQFGELGLGGVEWNLWTLNMRWNLNGLLLGELGDCGGFSVISFSQLEDFDSIAFAAGTERRRIEEESVEGTEWSRGVKTVPSFSRFREECQKI